MPEPTPEFGFSTTIKWLIFSVIHTSHLKFTDFMYFASHIYCILCHTRTCIILRHRCYVICIIHSPRNKWPVQEANLLAMLQQSCFTTWNPGSSREAVPMRSSMASSVTWSKSFLDLKTKWPLHSQLERAWEFVDARICFMKDSKQ